MSRGEGEVPSVSETVGAVEEETHVCFNREFSPEAIIEGEIYYDETRIRGVNFIQENDVSTLIGHAADPDGNAYSKISQTAPAGERHFLGFFGEAGEDAI